MPIRAHAVRRASSIALAVLLLLILMPYAPPASSQDSPGDNVFLEDLGAFPAGTFYDLAYSNSSGEWVYASSQGLYHYNPASAEP
ncbi:MAG: hypothetical protein QCI38_04605, partial [Candidatus Thermoplasmatota archaeon]|nr:hypothetical protein [Candidatus Thermoplasmatota archaeon]